MKRWKRAGLKAGGTATAGVILVVWHTVEPHLLVAVASLGCFLAATVWSVAYMHAFCAAATRIDRGRVSDPAASEWYEPGRDGERPEERGTDG